MRRLIDIAARIAATGRRQKRLSSEARTAIASRATIRRQNVQRRQLKPSRSGYENNRSGRR